MSYPSLSLPPLSSFLPAEPMPVTHDGLVFGQFPAGVPFRPEIPIDPAYVPLPRDELVLNLAPEDLALAPSTSIHPAMKVGGVRHKASNRKGKKKGNGDENNDLVSAKAVIKRGRPPGTGNFSTADTWAMLEATANELPMGDKGWQAVAVAYNKYARDRGRPRRTPKSLSAKYKQLVKKNKLTGSGDCPPEVIRALEIDHLINGRAGTREVNDSDFDEAVSDAASAAGHHSDPITVSSEDDDETQVITARVKKADSTVPSARHVQATTGMGLIKKIANSLDPSGRAEQQLSTVQILTLSQQLRDAHQLNNTLRTELTQVYNRLSAAELKLELLAMTDKRHRPRRRTRRRVPIPYGDSEVISLTDTDSLSSDDPNKENHRKPITRVHPFPFPIKKEVVDCAMSTIRRPLQDRPINLPDTDTELPDPSVAFFSPAN